VPPPSSPGIAKIFAPAVIACLVVGLIWVNGSRPDRSGGFRIPDWLWWIIALMILTITWQGSRIAFNKETGEVFFLLSRILGCGFLVVFTGHLARRQDLVLRVLHSFFWGMLVLSALIIFIGFTGLNLFGDLRPPRTLGVQMPFHKTSGVLRSYGELGIMFSIAWAYFLAYRGKYPVWLQCATVPVMLLAVVIAQSRNIYLAITFITAVHFVLPFLKLRPVKIALIFVAILMPAIVDTALPTLSKLAFGRALIGAERFEMNVHSRGEQREIANDLIAEDPVRATAGMSHQEWLDNMGRVTGYDPVMLHNHFYSLMLFMGLAAGLVTIVGLYLVPGIVLAKRANGGNRLSRTVFVALLGGYSSLGFYEGWFSTAFLLLLSLIWILAFSRPNRPSGAAGVPPWARSRRDLSYASS
ncbi:MAG: hypothetical protein GWO24_19460, partial [Akkermansiaceae bacterium]|nr:hypothetical protein [Akkermansiaceae bacterium]